MASGVEAAYGYNVPNLLIDHAMRNPHITAGFWRGVNTNQNAVYMESFMDELAEAAGQDPLAFRMKLLKPKWAAVLKAAADKAGYGKPLPAGHFHGIAQVMGYGSYVAGVAEVSVSADGQLKIHKITAATNLRPRGQSGADRAPGRGLVRLRPVGGALRRDHRQGRRRRADQLRQLQRDAHRRDAEGRDRAGADAATSGAASASRPSPWPRPSVLNAIASATGKRVRNLPLMHHELKKGA